jgi:hypothetical protein
MGIRSKRRRGGPLYRRCGSQVISYVPERVVWELRLPGMKRAPLRLIEKAVYVIDEAGVRRVRQGLAVRLGRVRSG